MHFLFLIKNIFNKDKDLENKKHLIFFFIEGTFIW